MRSLLTISRARANRSAKLLLSSALGTVLLAPMAAQAQQGKNVETVVVTGTSIRGAQPVGSNLITMDRAAIENTGAVTTQQLLTNIPGLSGFGGNPQGTQGVPAALGIHGVGQGSSTATLVLIDGHRFPGQGGSESDPDPNLIPSIALQRVEVLPDGASAIYGSDAVSGVLNFVTRKDFSGIETNVQYGFADQYSSFNAAGMFGHSWDGGSVLLAYEYSSQSNLMNSARDFITARQDIRRGAADPSLFTGLPARNPAWMTTTPAAGPGTTGPYGATIPYPSTGVNFQNFNCPVATIAAKSSAPAYYYTPAGDYSGPGYSTSTSNQPSQGACDNLAYGAALPSVTTNDAMMQVRQQVTNAVTFDLEAIYGSHVSSSPTSRGTINAQVFGPNAAAGAGSNATTQAAAAAGEVNPFYVGNAATGLATEYVRYDFDALLGPGATSKTDTTALFMTGGLTWDLGNDQEIVLGTTFGANTIASHSNGVVSTPEALLALNGTASTSGTPGLAAQQDIFGLSTDYPASRVLTTLNALDVWDPPATNKTSAGVIASLKDGGTFTNANQGLQDVNLKFDGPVFALPAGAVKIAVGAEFLHGYFDEYGTRSTTAGPSHSNAAAYYYRNGREVYSTYLEINAPLVSPDMNVPLMRSFSIDVSGRYDKYSGIGDTENPKVGIDWTITDGLKARGSFGTSFVAPNLHDANPYNSQSQIQALTNQFANPVIPFGDTRPFNGGAGLANTWVATPADCAAGNGKVVNAGNTVLSAPYNGAFGCLVHWGATNGNGTSAGLRIPGGNGNLKPASGRNWSGGFDIDAGKFIDALDGLTLNVTYYDMEYHNLITNQQTNNNLPQLTYFAPPGGWTPTSPYIQQFIANRPVSTPLQAQIYGTYDNRLQNAYNIWQNGIDFAANYSFRTDHAGLFRVGISGNEMLRYSTQGGNTGVILDTKGGKNSPRYPSAELQFRAHLGWALDALSTDLSMNYVHPTQLNISSFPYELPGPNRGYPEGNPPVFTSAGTAHLGALITFNLNATYALGEGFMGLPNMVTNGTTLSLTVDNLLNTKPPFDPASNSATGGSSGGAIGNPVLRMISIGLRKQW